MRTTITIDEHLLERLKRRAFDRDTSVSRLIEEAVRRILDEEPEQAKESFELITFGKGGRWPRINLDKTSALLEMDDLERFGGEEN